jgi:hypothetical protein
VLRWLQALLEGRSGRNGRSATLSWERVAEQVAPVLAQVEASTGLTPAARSGLTEVCMALCYLFSMARTDGLLSMGESSGAGGPGARSGRGEHWVDTRCQVRVTEVRMALCHLFSMGESTGACSRWREQTSRKTPRAIRSSLLESSEHDGRSKEAPR